MKKKQIKMRSGVQSGYEGHIGVDDGQNWGQHVSDNIQTGLPPEPSLGSQIANAATLWK